MKVRALLAQRESELLEFKTSFGKDTIESLCAFANHKGGTVVIGVAPGGRPVGVSIGEETL
ncbi:MAG: ATP-binding protein [Planctomycetota bacterium]